MEKVKKGRPRGIKRSAVTTVAVSNEHHDIIRQIADGHNVPLSVAADWVFSEGVKHLKIEDVVIKAKRIVFEKED